MCHVPFIRMLYNKHLLRHKMLCMWLKSTSYMQFVTHGINIVNIYNFFCLSHLTNLVCALSVQLPKSDIWWKIIFSH